MIRPQEWQPGERLLRDLLSSSEKSAIPNKSGYAYVESERCLNWGIARSRAVFGCQNRLVAVACKLAAGETAINSRHQCL